MKSSFLALVLGQALVLSGCAGLSETALPRGHHTLDGVKGFYYSVCEIPPPGKEKACEDGAGYIDDLGAFYNWANEEFGE